MDPEPVVSECEHGDTTRLSTWDRLCRLCGKVVGLDQATDVDALLDRMAELEDGPELEEVRERFLEAIS